MATFAGLYFVSRADHKFPFVRIGAALPTRGGRLACWRFLVLWNIQRGLRAFFRWAYVVFLRKRRRGVVYRLRNLWCHRKVRWLLWDLCCSCGSEPHDKWDVYDGECGMCTEFWLDFEDERGRDTREYEETPEDIAEHDGYDDDW